MRALTRLNRQARAVRKFAHGLADTSHPLLVHIIPIRRCNIDCGYCNEYDKVSEPVATATMLDRIDHLAALDASVISFSGGEPLLHPDLDQLIARIRSHGMMAGLITNGFLLSPKRIDGLNRAGLDYLQISIDNVVPDEVSKKSLKTLDSRLVWLRDHAHFDININSVLGGGIKTPEDARTITERARGLGFSTSIGIIHDGSGRLKPLAPRERVVYDDVSRRVSKPWQVWKNLYRGSGRSATTWPTGSRTSGGAARAPGTSTFAKTAWSTTARSSAGIPAFPSSATPWATSSASSWRRSRARRTARLDACTAPRPWTTGATRRSPLPVPRTRTPPKCVVRSP